MHVGGEDEPGGVRVGGRGRGRGTVWAWVRVRVRGRGRVRVRVRGRGRGRGRGRVRVATTNCILGPSLIQMLVLRILSSSGWISVKLTWRRWGG